MFRAVKFNSATYASYCTPASKQFVDISVTFSYLPKRLKSVNILASVNEPLSCQTCLATQDVLFKSFQRLPYTEKLEIVVEITMQAHEKSQTTNYGFEKMASKVY